MTQVTLARASVTVPSHPVSSTANLPPPLPDSRRLPVSGIVALGLMMVIILLVTCGPMLWTADPTRTQLTAKFAGFSPQAPLGRDEFGRDILSRLLHGGRLSLVGAVVVLFGCTTLGLTVGGLAGSLGGRTDAILSRVVEGLLALPPLVVALAIVGVLGKSFADVLLAVVITTWPWYARIYRGLFLRERQQTYVLAARAIGVGPLRIMWRHIGPNILGPVQVLSTVSLGGAILSLTALSFLGLGVQPPQAEWGAMVNTGRPFFQTQPWVIVAPGLAISLTVIAVNILGDALRDYTDPRT